MLHQNNFVLTTSFISKLKDVIIVGGGLSGLTSAINMAKAGLDVLLVEKKTYPFHRVCGEYISNEVLPYLKFLEIDIQKLGIAPINKFFLSAPSGKFLESKLEMGGFGISRYVLDNYLYEHAKTFGVEFLLGVSAEDIKYEADQFIVKLSDSRIIESKVAISAYGKRTKLDKDFGRKFINQRSPYVGIKYHIKTDFPNDLVALHNFKDGYCGISKIEDDLFNLCYLTHRNNLKSYKNIKEMEEAILFKNPFLKKIFLNASFQFEKPEVINEISFEKKSRIETHILMTGDAAGMITPLCGNGMAMAIHGGKIASEAIIAYFRHHHSREKLEKQYSTKWQAQFGARLWVGRNIQKMFGKEILSEAMIGLFQSSQSLTRFIIKQTHGKEF